MSCGNWLPEGWRRVAFGCSHAVCLRAEGWDRSFVSNFRWYKNKKYQLVTFSEIHREQACPKQCR